MKLLSLPYIIWMTGFIIIPLLMILYYGLSDKNNHFTLDNIALITDPINQKALLLALELSIISTVICLLLAYPLAMILRKSSKNSNNFIVL
ncbi:MAG TPA: ABC transporter permease, partial [Lachnospiraceae bacterium]|nr:ABC transporter permease [Lachnospiraceae bacterium]